jgi:hypothetical protein
MKSVHILILYFPKTHLDIFLPSMFSLPFSFRSEVLTAVPMKSIVLWGVMLCSPVDVHQYFRGPARSQQEADSKPRLTLQP